MCSIAIDAALDGKVNPAAAYRTTSLCDDTAGVLLARGDCTLHLQVLYQGVALETGDDGRAMLGAFPFGVSVDSNGVTLTV